MGFAYPSISCIFGGLHASVPCPSSGLDLSGLQRGERQLSSGLTLPTCGLPSDRLISQLLEGRGLPFISACWGPMKAVRAAAQGCVNWLLAHGGVPEQGRSSGGELALCPRVGRIRGVRVCLSGFPLSDPYSVTQREIYFTRSRNVFRSLFKITRPHPLVQQDGERKRFR